MKVKFLSLLRPVLFAFVGLSLVFACSKINPIDGVELTVNNDVYISPILVRAVNADANSNVFPAKATATISGKNADLVVDDLGNKGTGIKMVNGVLTLNLLPEANPSKSKPIIFNVFVQCDGFVSSNQTIRITDAKEPLKIYIPLVSLTAPPKGVTVAQQTVSLTAGVTKSVVQVIAPSGNSKTESASISIPAGTQIQDGNGNAINASSLNMQVTHFGTTTPQSIQAFPGGFIAENATTIDGKNQPVTFKTAGFLAINMDAGGKEVKNFSTPIDVSVGVNKDLVNPITKLKIKENDTVPVWSLNNETGAWKEEGVAIIIKDVSGNLIANFKAKHLSCWNLDWSWDYFGSFGDCSNATLTINVKSNLTKEKAVSPYEVQIQQLDGSYLAGLHSQEMYDGLSLTIPRMPAIDFVKIVVYNTETWPWRVVGEVAPFKPCDVGTVQVNIDDTPPSPITLNIDFTAKCSNKDVKIRPSEWVTFWDLSGWDWKDVYLDEGKLTVQVKEGVEYYVSAYYGGNYYTGIGKFEKTGSTFVPFGVSGLTGDINYNATTNTATLKAVYTSNSCK